MKEFYATLDIKFESKEEISEEQFKSLKKDYDDLIGKWEFQLYGLLYNHKIDVEGEDYIITDSQELKCVD